MIIQMALALVLALGPSLLAYGLLLRQKSLYRQAGWLAALLVFVSLFGFSLAVKLVQTYGLYVPGNPADFDSPAAMEPVKGLLYGFSLTIPLYWISISQINKLEKRRRLKLFAAQKQELT